MKDSSSTRPSRRRYEGRRSTFRAGFHRRRRAISGAGSTTALHDMPSNLPTTLKQFCNAPHERRAPRTLALILVAPMVLLGTSLAARADAKTLFKTHCASCHGPDGKARTPVARKLGVKDLTESKTADEEIERQILEGTKDKQGNQRMPPFKQKLSADDVKVLVEWVKSLRVTK